MPQSPLEVRPSLVEVLPGLPQTLQARCLAARLVRPRLDTSHAITIDVPDGYQSVGEAVVLKDGVSQTSVSTLAISDGYADPCRWQGRSIARPVVATISSTDGWSRRSRARKGSACPHRPPSPWTASRALARASGAGDERLRIVTSASSTCTGRPDRETVAGKRSAPARVDCRRRRYSARDRRLGRAWDAARDPSGAAADGESVQIDPR